MKTVTREEYKEYLKEQRRNIVSDNLSVEMREFIKANNNDLNKAFIGTNISVVAFPDEEPKKITLYQAFCTCESSVK